MENKIIEVPYAPFSIFGQGDSMWIIEIQNGSTAPKAVGVCETRREARVVAEFVVGQMVNGEKFEPSEGGFIPFSCTGWTIIIREIPVAMIYVYDKSRQCCTITEDTSEKWWEEHN